MDLLRILTFVIVNVICVTRGFQLNCNFNFDKWDDLFILYTCHVQNLNLNQENINITSLAGRHDQGQDNYDVQGLRFNNGDFQYLPGNFMNFFPNLKALNIYAQRLSKLTRHDLRDARNLKYLDILVTQITSLPSDLLIGFDNLVWFRMNDNNQLMYIGSKILDPLKNVRYIQMKSNRCINIDQPSLGYGSNQILRNCYHSNLEQTEEELIDIRESFLPKRLEKIPISLKNCLSVMEEVDTEITAIKDQYTVTIECLFDNDADYSFETSSLKVANQNLKIIKVTGKHKDLKANADVKELRIFNGNMNYFPINLFDIFTSLNVLRIVKASLVYLDDNLFKNAVHLKKLIIEFNNIPNVNANVFEGADNLELLKMENNQIIKLTSQSFNGLKKLEILLLGSNEIVDIPNDIFDDLINLKMLTLSNNRITVLDGYLLQYNARLVKFHCNDNLLTQIGSELFDYSRTLRNINLKNNKCIDSSSDLMILAAIKDEIVDQCPYSTKVCEKERNMFNMLTVKITLLTEENLILRQKFDDSKILNFVNMVCKNISSVQ